MADILPILGEVVRTIILVMLIPWLAWFSVRVINLEKHVAKEIAERKTSAGLPCSQHGTVVKDIFDRLNTVDKNVAEMHGWLKGKFDK